MRVLPIERRTGLAGRLALTAALMLAGSACPGQPRSAGSSPAGDPSPVVAHSSPSSGPASPEPNNGVFAAMLQAIRASSPPGWRFTLTADRLDGDWRLDGDVDDGSGPGRLLLDLTVRPNMLLAHPCADAEFRQGGRCIERSLLAGDVLVLRDVVVDPGGMKTIEAVLVHPDGSGVGAEAGNWTLAPIRDDSPTPETGLGMPRVTRPDPLYTVDRLSRLVRTVDETTSGCIDAGCAYDGT